MKHIACLLLIVALCMGLRAQQTTVIPGSFVAGNASVTHCTEWLPFHTPAALAAQQHIGIQLLYENRYFTKELANKAVNVWFPTKALNVGVAFSHFGYASYNEMLAAVTMARYLGKRVRLGIEFDYYTAYFAAVQRYRGTVTAQVGLQVDITETLQIAVNTFNPTFSRVKAEMVEKRLPTTFAIGMRYCIKNTVDWLVQIDKEVQSPLRWATGFEYAPVKQMMIRLGVYGMKSFVPTLGVGIRFGGFAFDVSADYTNPLGFSMLGALRYQFGSCD